MARPVTTWHGFCGQRHITDSLDAHCNGALRKSKPLPHVLLGGQSGIGKTALAESVAKAIGTKCHHLYCEKEMKPEALSEKLKVLNVSDILFLDEVHALPYACQELLYPAIDTLELRAASTSDDPVKIKPFTLIVASDRVGTLRNALKQRMTLNFTMFEYQLEEMRVIASNYAASPDIGLLLNSQAVTRIAEAARGIPRKIRHLMTSLSLCHSDSQAEVTKVDVVRCLAALGIDKNNLNGNDRRYLGFMAERSEPISLQSISSWMALDPMFVSRDIEAYLSKQGWVNISPRGRQLTNAGRTFVMTNGVINE